jgi:hypothetical protein
MKRVCAVCVACVLLLGLGCASDKGQWDEFWKDVRGDNMQMQSNLTAK